MAKADAQNFLTTPSEGDPQKVDVADVNKAIGQIYDDMVALQAMLPTKPQLVPSTQRDPAQNPGKNPPHILVWYVDDVDANKSGPIWVDLATLADGAQTATSLLNIIENARPPATP